MFIMFSLRITIYIQVMYLPASLTQTLSSLSFVNVLQLQGTRLTNHVRWVSYTVLYIGANFTQYKNAKNYASRQSYSANNRVSDV